MWVTTKIRIRRQSGSLRAVELNGLNLEEDSNSRGNDQCNLERKKKKKRERRDRATVQKVINATMVNSGLQY